MTINANTSDTNTARKRHPIMVRADEGQALWHLGTLIIFKATGEETENRHCWIGRNSSAG